MSIDLQIYYIYEIFVNTIDIFFYYGYTLIVNKVEKWKRKTI